MSNRIVHQNCFSYLLDMDPGALCEELSHKSFHACKYIYNIMLKTSFTPKICTFICIACFKFENVVAGTKNQNGDRGSRKFLQTVKKKKTNICKMTFI